MKTLKIFTATLFAILTLTFSLQAQSEKKPNPNAEVTFSTSIDCVNCKKKCEANLPFVKGVKDVKVDLDNHTIWFRYDEKKVSKQLLAAEIVKLGYTATEIETVKKDK